MISSNNFVHPHGNFLVKSVIYRFNKNNRILKLKKKKKGEGEIMHTMRATFGHGQLLVERDHTRGLQGGLSHIFGHFDFENFSLENVCLRVLDEGIGEGELRKC